MKTLNFDIFESYLLTSDEMIKIKGGGEGEPVTPPPSTPPIKI
jgi:hypothetical protein